MLTLHIEAESLAELKEKVIAELGLQKKQPVTTEEALAKVDKVIKPKVEEPKEEEPKLVDPAQDKPPVDYEAKRKAVKALCTEYNAKFNVNITKIINDLGFSKLKELPDDLLDELEMKVLAAGTDGVVG